MVLHFFVFKMCEFSFYILADRQENFQTTRLKKLVVFRTLYLNFLVLLLFLGELGGNMGLFLGCSVLTLFEFVEFTFSLFTAKKKVTSEKNVKSFSFELPKEKPDY